MGRINHFQSPYPKKKMRLYMRKYRKRKRLNQRVLKYLAKGICPICGAKTKSAYHIQNGQGCFINILYILQGISEPRKTHYMMRYEKR